MKKLLLSFFAITSFMVANAQYHYIVNKGNPGGVNADFEFSTGNTDVFPAGWNTIYSTVSTTPSWTSSQAIGFPFSFNGNDVTNFKVSTSGVLTFDVATALAAPMTENAALPSALIPDQSICIWGLQTTARTNFYPQYQTNAIVTKTFGAAGNRQLWIQFNQYGEPELQLGWSYWSIVLEEGTNKIYVVDQNTQCVGSDGSGCSTKTQLTIGVQIDGTTASQVAGSPFVPNKAGASFLTSDNYYYEFANGAQELVDAHIIGNQTPTTTTNVGSPSVSIAVDAVNLGSTAITTGNLNYSINGGAAVTAALPSSLSASVPTATSVKLTHPVPFTPTSSDVGELKTVKVWISDINGGASSSDTFTLQFVINSGVSGDKHVLIEEGSGAWCGYCPDGHLKLRDILKDNDKVVGVVHHNSDGMTNPASDIVNYVYATGYPYGTVDKMYWSAQSSVGVDRGQWASKASTRLQATTPLNLSIINKTYNESTRTVSFDVKADFVDYMAGDMRVNVYIVEDNVRGPINPGYNSLGVVVDSLGTEWTQHSYYSKYFSSPQGGAGHELYNEPEYLQGYFHNHVVMNILTSPFGQTGAIPFFVSQNESKTQHFTYTLPPVASITSADFHGRNTTFTPLQSTMVGDARNKHYDTKLVAFVSLYNPDPNKQQILNVTEVPMAFAVGVNEVKGNNELGTKIFPNPTNDITRVDFTLTAASNVTVEIYDIMGKKIADVSKSNFGIGDHSVTFDASNMNNGVYFVAIKSNNGNATQKFIVSK